MSKRIRLLIAATAALASSACVVGPKYVKPAVPTSAAFKEPLPLAFKEAEGWKAGDPKDHLQRGKWWEIFNDPLLNSLEEQIDINNQTLAAAEAQFRGARATIRVAHAGLYPTITAGGAVIGNGTSGNIGTSALSVARQAAILTVPNVGATWVPDLWGQVRHNIEAATDTAQAAAGDLENVRLLMQSEIALFYFQLRGLDSEKQLLDSNVVGYERALTLATNRYNQGVASQVDVEQAQTQLVQTRAQSTDTLVVRQQLEHAIAILIGKPPSQLTIPVAAQPVNIPPIPGAIASELLERRPDIAANERRVAAANAQLGATIAAYYPTITLNASGGLQSSSLLTLFTWPSRFWSLGPQLSETIFDAGRRRGVTEQARAIYDQVVANYRQSVLTAFQNVEDDLSTLRILEQESGEQDSAVRHALRSLELANAQYQGGITTYLQVITAQTVALANQRVAVQINTRRMTASVALIQALGGGWDVSKMPTAAEVSPVRATH